MHFRPRPTPGRSARSRPISASALDLEFVDLFKGASHTPAYLAINPTGRTPTLVDGDFKLGEFDRDHAVPRQPEAELALAERRAHPRRHHALAELGARALEQGGLRAADVPAAGEEVLEPRRARRGGRRQGPRMLQQGSQPCSTPIWRSSPISSARSSRSPTSRSQRRCSTPRRPACRSRPIARVQEWFGRVSALPCWRETAPQRSAAAA